MCKCKEVSPCNFTGTKSINNLNNILDIKYEIVFLRLKNYLEAEKCIHFAKLKHCKWLFPFRWHYNKKVKEARDNMRYFNNEIEKLITKLNKMNYGKESCKS